MNHKDSRILRRRKRKLAQRLARKPWAEQPRPMLTARNIRYEMAARTRAIDCGGIGAFHLLARRTGLVRAIDQGVRVLKAHLPYHESDHVLNIAYNTLTGGTCLDDIELRRNDEAYLDALGAERIPDPTTAGDFARRFGAAEVRALMEAINQTRAPLWRRLSGPARGEAVLDADGMVAPTTGECKQGMDLAYNGVWGYHPLLISLANTQEVLYLVNRPGNRPSHEGAAEWLDRAIALVRRGGFARVCLRGDTDFALTGKFDEWTAAGVGFVFGLDAMPNLVALAEGLKPGVWRPLARPVPRPAGPPRERPENVKEQIVIARQYQNVRQHGEDVAEFAYLPGKCRRACRVIVLRKNLSVAKGERRLFDEIRYFFYITNRTDLTPAETVHFANDRGQQENLIEQLKNGLNALRMPVGDLASNWAYMVMAALAWNLKAWFALLTPRRERREQLLRMEFRRFLNGLVRLPAQIVRTGRRIVYRLLGYNEWLPTFLATFDAIRALCPARAG